MTLAGDSTTRTLFEAMQRTLVCAGRADASDRRRELVVSRGSGRLEVRFFETWGCSLDADARSSVKRADAVVFGFGLHVLHLYPWRPCNGSLVDAACVGRPYGDAVRALAADVRPPARRRLESRLL